MSDRPVWRTQKIRAQDVRKDDVTRNRYGKWDVVVDRGRSSTPGYTVVVHDKGGEFILRDVDLVDVQVVKPS